MFRSLLDDEEEAQHFMTLPSFNPKQKPKELPKEAAASGLKIVPFETKKHSIKQRSSMKDFIIPKHPSSTIFNGRSGSGKSNLLVNLLTKPEFYGKINGKHYFDKIHLFSPTAGDMDDLCTHLKDHANLKGDDIHNEFDQEMLMGIMDKQAKIIKKKGDISKAPKVLILLDDIQSDKKFLASKAIKRLFLMNRHYGISTWLCGQSFNLTPRACRLQANNLFMFPMGGSEMKVLLDEFTPPGLNKKEFQQLVEYATGEQYQFLHINMKAPPKERFRKNLDTILEIQ